MSLNVGNIIPSEQKIIYNSKVQIFYVGLLKHMLETSSKHHPLSSSNSLTFTMDNNLLCFNSFSQFNMSISNNKTLKADNSEMLT